MKTKIIAVLCTLLCLCGMETTAQNRQLIQAEYFWDSDPGQGNGTALQAADGSLNEAVEQVLGNGLGLPSAGVHTFHVRVRDNAGNWSAVFSKVILIEGPLPTARGVQVIQAEYFWDTDPGAGSGNAMLAFDGNFNESVEGLLANVGSLPGTGAHKLGIRLRAADGQWGPVFYQVVYIQPGLPPARPSQITLAEYFWDTDPGAGNGTAMLAFDGNFNESIETVLANAVLPSVGNHKFGIRVRESAANWSPVFYTVVQVQATLPSARPVQVTAAEYFWDTDPGQGSGSAMLAFDGNFNEAVETVMQNIGSLPSAGAHKLGIRIRDAANNWGPVFSTVVYVQPTLPAPRPMKVTLAECYFDVDPGAGTATPMLAFDGNFNAAIETVTGGNIPSPVIAGYHALYIRIRDGALNWGPAYGVVVNIDTILGGYITVINGPDEVCENELNGNTYTAGFHAGTTYNWTVTGGTIVGGINTNIITVNWNATGAHTLQVIECTTGNAYCDTANYTVTIIDTNLMHATATICAGQSILLGGSQQTQPGTYFDVYTNAAGCDSTISTVLTVLPSPVTTLNQTICAGQSYLGYTTSGVYNDVFAAANGCDSMRTLNLTVLQPDTVHVFDTICPGGSSHGYTVAGIYQDDFTNLAGCDSSRFLHLTVQPLITTTIVDTICSGQQVAGYTQTGVYSDTFNLGGGCDSIRILDLTVLVSPLVTITDTVCEGDTVEGYFTSGVFTNVFFAANGCDSTRVLNLTVLASPLVTVYDTICQGQNSQGYTTAGVYTDVFTALNGCDSTRILHLEIWGTDTVTINTTVCAGDTVEGYFATGNYTDIFSNRFGCDSVRYLNLTVLPTPFTTLTVTICDGETLAGYDSTGTYTDVFTAANGCDSTRVLNLTVQPLNITTTVLSICMGDSVFAEGEWQKLTGVYYDTTGFTGNCPDITITDLTVHPLPATPVIYGYGDTLLTVGGLVTYQWFLDGDSIIGATDDTVFITGNGLYTVDVSDTNGCHKTSNSFVVTWVGIERIDGSQMTLVYYPNPTTGMLFVALPGVEEANLQVMNGLGQTLYSGKLYNGNLSAIDMGSWAAGIYYLNVQHPQFKTVQKVVKTD